MSIKKKRAYHSASRKAQAQETKRRILSSSKELFEVNGYENVTVEELARHAKVSATSIYTLYQSKRGILKALMDETLFGYRYDSLVQKVKLEKSAKERLKLAASIARHVHDSDRSQMGLLRGAAAISPELKELERDLERQRFERQEETVEMLAKENALAGSLAKTRDILWTMTGRDTYRMLVIERGWSSGEYEKWLAGTLTQILTK